MERDCVTGKGSGVGRGGGAELRRGK